MFPKLGPVPVYACVYWLSLLVYPGVCYFFTRRLHIRRRVWIPLSICYVFGMTAGAKVLFDIQHGHFSLGALFTWHHWMAGGMWGGPLAFLALAVPLVLVLSRDKRICLDLIALSLPVPMMIAKVACVCHGCCYGRQCALPWAIVFPEGAVAPANTPLHPTQIYEMLVLVCVMVVFSRLDRDFWRGTLLLWFLGIYGFGRAATEIWRGDKKDQILLGPVSISQLICVGVALLSVLLLVLDRHRATHGEVPAEQDPNVA